MTRIELPEDGIVGIRAQNPGPLTLSGTNSWIIGSDPGWLIDPGPDLADHVATLIDEIERRGGLGGVALTHDHADHSEAVDAIRARYPGVPLAAARGPADIRLTEATRFGPLEATMTPGHAPDHVVFIADSAGHELVAFTGDSVLGEGSVFIWPHPGALAGYLDALARLRERGVSIMLPGHGPPVTDPRSKLAEYIDHRLDRERRLLAALSAGRRTVDELLEEAWADAPAALRPAAAFTLAAHLDKLADEGRLPDGVERPGGWS